MTIDDPGILTPGEWELIFAIAGEDRDSGRNHQFPILDASYGLTANTQLSLSVPWQLDVLSTATSESGPGEIAVGYKWRFFTNSNSEWAIAPSYAFAITSENDSEKENTLSIPLLASWSLGEWTLMSQVGLNVSNRGNKDWSYGVAATHPLGEAAEWMIELYGDSDSGLNTQSLNFQLGIDYAIGEEFHVLVGLGSGITSETENDKLNFAYFVGIQWFP